MAKPATKDARRETNRLLPGTGCYVKRFVFFNGNDGFSRAWIGPMERPSKPGQSKRDLNDLNISNIINIFIEFYKIMGYPPTPADGKGERVRAEKLRKDFFSRVSEATLGTFPGRFCSAFGAKVDGVSVFRVV